MKNILKSLAFLLVINSSVQLRAQSDTTLSLFEKQLFIQGDDTLKCRIMSPVDFVPGKKYPLIVFLHGAGERGGDNEKQLVWGADFFADSANRANFPAIVVFPQCPKDSTWNVRNREQGGVRFPMDVHPTKPMALVMQFIDTLMESGIVDKKRVYLGGLSMGGFGTFELLWRKPGLFAAAFPICGGGNTASVGLYGKKFPIWVFHGADDTVVLPELSQNMVEALKAVKAKVKYTEYAGVAHDSWINAFKEPDLLPWLFSHNR